MEDLTPIKPPEPPKPYTLAADERAGVIALASNVSQAKLQIYELNMQLEIAQKQRDAAEARFGGALNLLCDAHGIKLGKISADFTTLTPQ